MARSILPIQLCGLSFPMLGRPSMQLCSCAWRLTLEVSPMDAWGAIAGNVKCLLPPRQSRGISFVSLDRRCRDYPRCTERVARAIGKSFAQYVEKGASWPVRFLTD